MKQNNVSVVCDLVGVLRDLAEMAATQAGTMSYKQEDVTREIRSWRIS